MNDDSLINGSEDSREIPAPEYPACAPGRLPADQITFVEAIHNQFLQLFAQNLSAYLEVSVAAASSGIEQVPVSSFMEAAERDACLVTLDLAPLHDQAWVGLSTGFAFRVLDILLGAPANSAPGEARAVTEIEIHILREFFTALSSSLDAAWSSAGIHFQILSTSSVRDLARKPDPDNTILQLNCTVQLGEAEESFRIAVPALSVRLAALQLEQAAAGQSAGDAPSRSAILGALQSATLQLETVLGGSTVRMSDLATIQPGQVLMLGQPAGSLLECLINGKAKFRGEWITHGNRHAFQVDSLVLPAPGSPQAAQA